MIKTAQKTVKVSHPPTFQLPRIEPPTALGDPKQGFQTKQNKLTQLLTGLKYLQEIQQTK